MLAQGVGYVHNWCFLEHLDIFGQPALEVDQIFRRLDQNRARRMHSGQVMARSGDLADLVLADPAMRLADLCQRL